jgi:hypothetical protein
MKHKYPVWIVEDHRPSANRARAAVERAAEDRGIDVDITLIEEIAWKPELRSRTLPFLIILDMYMGESTPSGVQFYEDFRRREILADRPNRAFVIIWSSYTSDERVEDFIREKRDQDDRMVVMPTKDSLDLGDKIKRCLGRIEEELP